MKFLGYEFRRAMAESVGEGKAHTFNIDWIRNIISNVVSPESVNPENCMQSPTVHAIVTAIRLRFAVTPLHVYQKGSKDNRETKERLPDHPVTKLLSKPNSWQSRVDYCQDAASWFARYGRY